MIARLRPWVIVLALSSATSPLAQQLPTAPLKQPSDAVGTQGAQIPDAVKAQPSQHQQSAAPNTPVQHSATQPPNDQAGGRDGSSGSDGKSSGQINVPKPEEVTAEYTVYLVIATIALVIATIVLAVSTIGLSRQTKRLADEAVNQGEKTERQIQISEKSAQAAQTAAQAASDSVASGRAWVMFAGAISDSAHKSVIHGTYYENGCMVTIAWKNYGHSPALNVRLSIKHLLLPKGSVPEPFVFTDFGTAPGVAFAPDQTHQSNPTVIDHQDFQKLRKGEIYGFIYGCCEYLETPASVEPRRSEFCGQIAMVEMKPRLDGSFDYQINLASYGNQNTAT